MDPQSSSSSSSSSMSGKNYGVFLSFRGPDTRHTFISHLYHALDKQGLYTFKDSEELEAGQRRSELFKAIEGSQVAIVTFSENYARSKWCLNELHEIMERKGQGKLTVLPIFYHVDPREVRLHEKESGEKGCYQIAMEEMEATYGRDSETVRRWRKALREGGDLTGIKLDQGKDEGNVVRDVVQWVSKTLNPWSREVAKYPVGIDRRLREIRRLLHVDPRVNDVLMIGLHGPGGAGKTTLSNAIWNDIADRFKSRCFLQNVRETTLKDGLAHLQQTLLAELLSDEGLRVRSVDVGKQLIKERLRNKRVLIILDDIDESNEMDALAGNVNWFGGGSMIILTTRNRHLLTSNGVPEYKINLLEEEEADKLFRLHAFGEMQEKIKIDGDLINRFVKYACKLPLALVLLGAFLRGRSESEWEGKMKELATSPDSKINTVLKISFDGLEENHKEMFLDVACFYKGMDIDRVEKILDSCDFAPSLGIKILVERCLITVVDGRIQMHDLVVAMGQSIARKGGMLSRIWLYEDFLHILSEDRSVLERQAVKGIVLGGTELDDAKRKNEIFVKSNALLGFKKLRVLILSSWNFVRTKKLLQLPSELRWLEWFQYPASAVKFDPSSKLVCLDLMDSSSLQQINAKGWEELKYVNLLFCNSLKTFPDLSRCRNLKELTLGMCGSLTKLDNAVGSLENLVHLNLSCCENLKTVPSSLISKRLQTLDFGFCSGIKKLPAIKQEHKFLEVLVLKFTALKELPDSIRNLIALKKLVLSECSELTKIPSSIYEMRALEVLDLSSCDKLSVFPRKAAGAVTGVLGFPNLVSLEMSGSKLKDLEFLNDLTCFETLKQLDQSGGKFSRVPACISKFKNLETLDLVDCCQLVEVTELPNVPDLRVAKCLRLETFPSLDTFICPSPKKFYVDLSGCHSLDPSYINRSLPLEHVRGFIEKVEVLYPGEEFPGWVNFQTGQCGSRYHVSFPSNMSKDDLFGLALFISFESNPRERPCNVDGVSLSIGPANVFALDGVLFWAGPIYHTVCVDGVHSWFFYVPRHMLVQRNSDSATDSNGRDITLEFSEKGWWVRKWGMRLLCKQEQDDDRIEVCEGKNGEGDSIESEYESKEFNPVVTGIGHNQRRFGAKGIKRKRRRDE